MTNSTKLNRLLIRWICIATLSLFLSHNAMAESQQVKMVVTAAFVSDKGLNVYEDLAKYVADKLDWDVDVISGLSYDESNSLLEKGIIQVGFVCGLPYVQMSRKDSYHLMAAPVMAMKKGTFPDAKGYEDVPGKYYAYTIVRKDSPLSSWEELKGKTYAFNETISNSGYNMPRYKLIQLGANSWEEYFSKVIVSGSHEESIRLVSQGIVDASSVDSLVLDYDRTIGDPDALNVKIIEHLHPGGAGIPPVVMSNKADPAIHKAFLDLLLNMHKDPEGMKILEKALISHFMAPNDANYDDIRMMEDTARKASFQDYTGL